MSRADRVLAQTLEAQLTNYSAKRTPLRGISNPTWRASLIEQIIESVHRVNYVAVLKSRTLSVRRMDPNDDLFDPIKAAILHQTMGRTDEAFWLVFLFVHFGRHSRGGWRYIQAVYGRLGGHQLWDWNAVSQDPVAFRTWLDTNMPSIQSIQCGFGNHRKYQSLRAWSATGTGAAVESYVRWVNPPRTHTQLFEQAYQSANQDSRATFRKLYVSMSPIVSFGRTARFDYLTMVGKLELAPITPDSTYMDGSTGPVAGARLLFDGATSSTRSARDLDQMLIQLDSVLNVGMQVLEDSLCNWQKSPSVFKPFRG